MIDKIHDISLNDRQLKVREISETVNISVGHLWHILHEYVTPTKKIVVLTNKIAEAYFTNRSSWFY